MAMVPDVIHVKLKVESELHDAQVEREKSIAIFFKAMTRLVNQARHLLTIVIEEERDGR